MTPLSSPQFTAFAWDGIAVLNPPFGNPIQPQPTWTWTSSNTGIATINSSTGLATGVGSGVCEIIATATVGLQTFSGAAMFGCALISPGTATITNGACQNGECIGYSSAAKKGTRPRRKAIDRIERSNRRFRGRLRRKSKTDAQTPQTVSEGPSKYLSRTKSAMVSLEGEAKESCVGANDDWRFRRRNVGEWRPAQRCPVGKG